jgi:hypothetical protein
MKTDVAGLLFRIANRATDIALHTIQLLFAFFVTYRPTLHRNRSRILTTIFYVGFEVLIGVVVKNPIFWDITPCSR